MHHRASVLFLSCQWPLLTLRDAHQLGMGAVWWRQSLGVLSPSLSMVQVHEVSRSYRALAGTLAQIRGCGGWGGWAGLQMSGGLLSLPFVLPPSCSQRCGWLQGRSHLGIVGQSHLTQNPSMQSTPLSDMRSHMPSTLLSPMPSQNQRA